MDSDAMDRPGTLIKRERIATASALILALLVLLFFAPVLTPPAGQATGGIDIRGLFVPWLTTLRDAVHAGQLPFWDPYQMGGYPFLANPQVAAFYPPTWLALLAPPGVAIGLLLALHCWLLALGMLLFVRSLGANWTGAIIAAVSLAFSSFVAARVFAGHLGLLATFTWLPWLLLTFARSVRRRTLSAAVLVGLPLGLAILSGHTTSLIYVGLIWATFALYLALENRPRLVATHFLVAAAVGVGLSAVQLAPLAQFAAASSRAATTDIVFAADFSLPVTHLITLLLPEYFGEPIRIGYWSVPVFEEYAYYAGALVVLALALALGRRSRLAIFYVVLMALGLLIAVGRSAPLFELLYTWFPPFRLARAPARAAFLFTFAAAALQAEALTRWRLQRDDAALARLLRWVGAVTIITGVAALAATGALFSAQHPSDTSGRLWHQLGGWSWLILIITLGALLLWTYLRSQPGERRHRASAVLLVALVVVDLWHFGQKMVRLEPTAPPALWQEAQAVLGNTDERVLPWGVSIFDQNGAGQVGLYSIFGYNALALAPNDALTGSVPDPRSTAYDLFNVGYVVAPVPLDNFTAGDRALALVEQRGATWVYRRSRVMPVVRLAYEVEIFEQDSAAIQRIHEPEFDPATTVLLSEDPACPTGSADPGGEATLLARTPTHWRIAASSSAPAILVVSESAYPGWQVTIDGEPQQPLTAYTALRAVCVPAGEHVVEWRFRPAIYLAGAGVTLLTMLVLAFAVLKMRQQRG